MNDLCEVCDRSIFENLSEYKKSPASLRKENDKSLYDKHTIYNINLDEVDKMLSDYVTTHNKKFHFYLVRREFILELDNIFTTNIQTDYCYNMDGITKIKSLLLYWIDCFKSRGYMLININQMTITSLSDRCNMTYKNYMSYPMSMYERRINFIIAKNPQFINSLDRDRNHPLIRKYSHIPFNRI